MANSRRTEPHFSQPQEKHLHYCGRYFFKWDLHIKIRLWLSRVTCILTDCGAERKIPDMRDILPEFLDAIRGEIPDGLQNGVPFSECVASHWLASRIRWRIAMGPQLSGFLSITLETN